MTPDTTPLPGHPDTCGTDACVACWLEGELAKAEAERDEAIAKAELSRVCLADFQAVVRERDEARAEARQWRALERHAHRDYLDACRMLVEAREKVERMRPVVEAAEAWADYSSYYVDSVADALAFAVDVYREHEEAGA
jgi:hypothetical protein